MPRPNFKKQHGMALLASILLVGVLLGIVFTLTAILVPRIKVSGQTKKAIPALYAAEAGVEWCLYIAHQVAVPPLPAMLNGATYTNRNDQPLDPGGAECSGVFSGPPFLKVLGEYQGTTRAFEVNG